MPTEDLPINQRSYTQSAVEAIRSYVDPWPSTNFSQAASDAVHSASKTAGDLVRWGIIASGVAAGSAVGGAVGSVIGLGTAGAVIGGILGGVLVGPIAGAVGNLVGRAVDAIGGWIANRLGFDFITNGMTPGGGTWTNTRHPNGTFDRHEKSGGLDIHDWTDQNGGYHQTIDGNGYHSDYSSKSNLGFGAIGSTFNANDSMGGYHGITHDRESGTYVTADSNGKGNSTIHTSDGKGNSSTFKTETKDGKVTTTETNTTRDEKTGVTRTETTVTHPDGKKETNVTYADKDGKEVNPPPKEKGMENPEGGGSEGPRFEPGELGRPRPGHPNDMIFLPGQVQPLDNHGNESPAGFYGRLSDAMEAMALIINAGGSNTGWGDSSSEESADDLRSKLKDIYVTPGKHGDGVDFIHPKARSLLLDRFASAIITGTIQR